jgi:dolichyl-diphosphooligosaccharide--protein glycosyltransferase
MIGKYGAISYFGNWDFNQKKSFPDGYSFIRCSSLKNNTLYCSNLNMNLSTGIINFNGSNRRAYLRKTVFVNNGYVIKEKNYKDNKNGIFLQLLMKNNNIFRVLLLNNRVFNSNFNQQFILGNIDKKLYKEVYNNFPVARAFKLLPKN